MEGVRTFVAVFPPEDVQEKIGAIQAHLKESSAGVRWEPSGKFHFTVKFLGNVLPPTLRLLEDSLRSASASVSSFEVTLVTLGFFPPRRPPTVIWIGSRPEENAGLVRCFEMIDASAVRAGFEKENRPFHPHITLGRVKGKTSPNLITNLENATFETLKFPCNELLIMKSVLSPSGSTYSKQCTISLNH